jgi:BclA C-terminal domain
MYSLLQLKTLVSCGREPACSLPLRCAFLVIPLILVYLAFSPQARAETDVSPPPDGGYPGFTTAEGTNALRNLSSGQGNSAFGWFSLFSNTTANFNTGLGAGTLALNNGDSNTAVGTAALILNTSGTRNTANGTAAMVLNSTGDDNTAVGAFALNANNTGIENTAVGSGALSSNTTPGNPGESSANNAVGMNALFSNTTGSGNDAFGVEALFGNTTGTCNVALGNAALLSNSTGSDNIAVGCAAGSLATTGDNNIYIGNLGVAGESNTIRIGDPAIHQNVFIGGIPAGGLAAILFDFNSGVISILPGGAVPFNQAPLIVGTAISKTDNFTFTVNQTGVYRVTYTLRTALVSLLGNVQVQVNSVGVGPTAALIIAGAPLSDQVTFPANAGDAVKLVVGGLAIALAAGDNATINIDKVQ